MRALVVSVTLTDPNPDVVAEAKQAAAFEDSVPGSEANTVSVSKMQYDLGVKAYGESLTLALTLALALTLTLTLSLRLCRHSTIDGCSLEAVKAGHEC